MRMILRGNLDYPGLADLNSLLDQKAGAAYHVIRHE